MIEHLPNSSKQELAKALKEVSQACTYYTRCLLCEIEGWGRYDPGAVRAAAARYAQALEDVAEITGDEVPPLGLFAEAAR